jgi:pyruvate/2-oxoglutarate dehydrogenase complex dihydrolipoamide dehydrogenase (E3) component
LRTRTARARLISDWLINLVFTEPQITTVGLTEQEGETPRIAHRTARYSFGRSWKIAHHGGQRRIR